MPETKDEMRTQEIALEVFARLIEILAARRMLTSAEVLELVEIAKRSGGGK